MLNLLSSFHNPLNPPYLKGETRAKNASPLKIRGVRGVMKKERASMVGQYCHNPLNPPYLKGENGQNPYLKGENKGEKVMLRLVQREIIVRGSCFVLHTPASPLKVRGGRGVMKLRHDLEGSQYNVWLGPDGS